MALCLLLVIGPRSRLLPTEAQHPEPPTLREVGLRLGTFSRVMVVEWHSPDDY